MVTKRAPKESETKSTTTGTATKRATKQQQPSREKSDLGTIDQAINGQTKENQGGTMAQQAEQTKQEQNTNTNGQEQEQGNSLWTQVPDEIKEQSTKSAKIRALNAEGWTRSQIAKALEIRYQHVRNVLVNPPKKATGNQENQSQSE